MAQAKTVDQVVKKFVDRASSASAVQAYRDGINAVTENPMQKSADAEQKYVDKIMEAVTSGKRRASLLRVDFASWKNLAATKGGERLATGVKLAEPKMRKFMSEFLPYVQAGAQTVRAMPNNTEDDARARMLAMFEHNRRFRRTR